MSLYPKLVKDNSFVKSEAIKFLKKVYMYTKIN